MKKYSLFHLFALLLLIMMMVSCTSVEREKRQAAGTQKEDGHRTGLLLSVSTSDQLQIEISWNLP